MSNNANSRASARATMAASWLGLGRPMHMLSMALLVAALILLVLAPLGAGARTALLGAVLAGLLEFYYALRTAFDQTIFAAWAAAWEHPEASPTESMEEFDRLCGRETPPTAVRSLEARCLGARGLLLRQGACLALQAGAILVALVFGN